MKWGELKPGVVLKLPKNWGRWIDTDDFYDEVLQNGYLIVGDGFSRKKGYFWEILDSYKDTGDIGKRIEAKVTLYFYCLENYYDKELNETYCKGVVICKVQGRAHRKNMWVMSPVCNPFAIQKGNLNQHYQKVRKGLIPESIKRKIFFDNL